MKRWSNSPHQQPRTATAILSLCLVAVAGCSEGGAAAGGGESLDESEISAITASAKSTADLRELVKKKALEKGGVIIPTATTKKVSTRPR